MNPPNTAQIVNTRLLVKVLPSESLWSLSVTLGILILKILHKICQLFLDLITSPGIMPMSVRHTFKEYRRNGHNGQSEDILINQRTR